MGKGRRKRGRPRTGHDPMVGLRLPALLLRKIDKMAAEIGDDRSMIIRLMVEHVLGHGSPEVEICRSLLITGLLGRKGRRGTVAGRIASASRTESARHINALCAGGAQPCRRKRFVARSRLRSPRGHRRANPAAAINVGCCRCAGNNCRSRSSPTGNCRSAPIPCTMPLRAARLVLIATPFVLT
jgi:hypothetical protein